MTIRVFIEDAVGGILRGLLEIKCLDCQICRALQDRDQQKLYTARFQQNCPRESAARFGKFRTPGEGAGKLELPDGFG